MLPHTAGRSCFLLVAALCAPSAGEPARDIPHRAAGASIIAEKTERPQSCCPPPAVDEPEPGDLAEPSDLACLLQTGLGIERSGAGRHPLQDRAPPAQQLPTPAREVSAGAAERSPGARPPPLAVADISLAGFQRVAGADQAAFDLERALLGEPAETSAFGPMGHAVLRAGRRSGSWRCLILVACLLSVWVVQYGLPGLLPALSLAAAQNSALRGSLERYARQGCVAVLVVTLASSTLVAYARRSLGPDAAVKACPPQCRNQLVQDIFCVGAFGPEHIIFGAGLMVAAALAVPASSVASRAAVAHVGEVWAELAFLCASVGFGCMAGVGLVSYSSSAAAHWVLVVAMLALLAPLAAITGVVQGGVAQMSALALYICWGVHNSVRGAVPDVASACQWVGALAMLVHILSWASPSSKEPRRFEEPAAEPAAQEGQQ